MSSSVSILSSISNTGAPLRLFLKCGEPDHLEDMKAALLMTAGDIVTCL